MSMPDGHMSEAIVVGAEAAMEMVVVVEVMVGVEKVEDDGMDRASNNSPARSFCHRWNRSSYTGNNLWVGSTPQGYP